MQNVDTVLNLSAEDFEKMYFHPKKPVVYKGGANEKKYIKSWSFEYLASIVGSRLVKVNHVEDGVYNSSKNIIQQIEIPFVEALELFRSDKYVNKSYYLQRASIENNFPELLCDLEVPEWILPSDLINEVNLWIGGAGCVTPLHYDSSHNFLIQVRGKKELILFPPEDTKYLYPNEDAHHRSDVDVDNPDLTQFPLFSIARPTCCILEPGDILFLPPGWWHHVRSIDMCISVNYWWFRFDIPEHIGVGLIDVPQIIQLMKGFLDKGFSVNHKLSNGDPILLKAVKLKFANVVEALLSLGADANAVNVNTYPAATALLIAVEQDSKEIVKLLLNYQAVDDSDAALNLAIEKQNYDIVSLLRYKEEKLT